MPSIRETSAQIVTAYRRRTPKSAEWFEKGLRVMPGGDTRSSTFFLPYPTFMARGEGAKLYDVDGNILIDYLNNYTALIHGNAFPPVVEAARRQVERGTAWGAPNEDQVNLATLICERVPSVQQLRFTNSGTEATMQAIRAARAFTGRDLIIKIEGGYHGTHEAVAVSIEPDIARAGAGSAPLAVPAGPGVPRGVLEATCIVPFNDGAALERIISEHHEQIAAVILEPMMGSRGMIPADHEYLDLVREVSTSNGILLILDEVMTFRLDTGGAQGLYEVQPDLTAFAKIIGGGFPVGAFGGREGIMRLYDPARGKIGHGGTFNGNPVTMAAGVAAMQHVTPEKIAYINSLGESLRDGFRDVLEEQGINGQVTGLGSLVGVHLTAQPVRNYRGAASVRPILRESLHLGLLNRGIFTSPEGVLCTSTVMTHDDVNSAIGAFQDTLLELRPAIQEECPDLIRG
jgi:glutamate-1-semialdehyde 2,1-aminomutase